MTATVKEYPVAVIRSTMKHVINSYNIRIFCEDPVGKVANTFRKAVEMGIISEDIS